MEKVSMWGARRPPPSVQSKFVRNVITPPPPPPPHREGEVFVWGGGGWAGQKVTRRVIGRRVLGILIDPGLGRPKTEGYNSGVVFQILLPLTVSV
ncbi:hypothetical protein FKM82_026548 [Ascaphus truei]